MTQGDPGPRGIRGQRGEVGPSGLTVSLRAAIVFLAAILLLNIGSVVYNAESLHVAQVKNEQDQRKFCDVVDTVVDAYKSGAAPITDLGRKLKQEYFDLQERLGCT